MGRPGQVEVDLVSGHVGEFWKKDLNSHATVPTLKGGPNKALPLRAMIYWAHSLEWVQIKGGSILPWLTYTGSANNPNSAIAGHTEACVTRSRTRDVVIRGPLINRQLPMLVAVPNSSHWPFCH